MFHFSYLIIIACIYVEIGIVSRKEYLNFDTKRISENFQTVVNVRLVAFGIIQRFLGTDKNREARRTVQFVWVASITFSSITVTQGQRRKHGLM